jgi:opacity protein-like surface antigen
MIAPSWSLRGEYLYYGFTSNLNSTALAIPGATINGNVNKFNTSVVRLGLDYKFDWWR